MTKDIRLNSAVFSLYGIMTGITQEMVLKELMCKWLCASHNTTDASILVEF